MIARIILQLTLVYIECGQGSRPMLKLEEIKVMLMSCDGLLGTPL